LYAYPTTTGICVLLILCSSAHLHHRSVLPGCPASNRYTAFSISGVPYSLKLSFQSAPPEGLPWASFVHPEGQLYLTRVLSKFRVVVDLNIYEPSQESIDFWVKRMEDFVAMQDNQLLAGALELYLEPHELDPHQSCSYYLVSHSTRKVFWLEEVSSESLGMAPVVSDTHFGAYIRLFFLSLHTKSR